MTSPSRGKNAISRDAAAHRLAASTNPGRSGGSPRRLSLLCSFPFIVLIQLYRFTLGPFLGGRCRFHPTCSVYAIEAYRAHGPLRGSYLTVRRLARCHPFGGCGVDPVPAPRRRA